MAPSSIDRQLRRRLERHIDNLPVLPLALANLLALDPTSEDYFDDVVGILESEPNFAARVLVAANSAESSPVTPVTTLAGAVTRIGSRGATNLVLALSVTKVFVPRDAWERSLWRHGVQVAHAARALAKTTDDGDGINPDEVFTCALLHDLGRFVFFQEAPDQLRAIDEGDWDSPETLVEQELEICGISHPEIGGMACAKWGLPDVIEQAIRHHHEPRPERFTGPHDKLVAIVRFADLAMFPSAMPGAVGLNRALDAEGLAAFLESRQPSFLSLTGPEFAEIVRQAGVEADKASHALGIAS